MSHQPRYLDILLTGEGFDSDFALACVRSAENARVTGWVRCSDDQDEVRIHIEGLDSQTTTFMSWLRGGVDGVRIARIEAGPASRENWDEFEYLG